MKQEVSRFARLAIKLYSVKTAIFQKFDSGQGWAKANFEWPPIPSLPQSGAKAAGGVAKKGDARQAGEQSALPQDQIGMQVADNGLLDLGHSLTDFFFSPQERQRSRVVAKQQHAGICRQRCEGPTNFT
jgi:hypothetical protein